MAAASSPFEPEIVFCSAGECLEEAVMSSYATVRVGPIVDAPDGETLLTFTLPLCLDHALMLRSDNPLVEFHIGRAWQPESQAG